MSHLIAFIFTTFVLGLQSWAAPLASEVANSVAEPSSCVIILNGDDRMVVDRTILSASTLFQLPDVRVAFDPDVHGKVTSMIDADHTDLMGFGKVGFDGRIVAGTDSGQVLFLTTQPLIGDAKKDGRTRSDEIREENATSYFWKVSAAPITQISTYFDPIVRKNMIVSASAKGTRTIKRDGQTVFIHDLPAARQSLDMTSTREGVIGIFSKEIRRYTDVAIDKSRIKTQVIAQADHEFTAGDTCENNGVSAVIDGQTLKLIDSRGDSQSLATLQPDEKVQMLKLSALGNRLAMKTTSHLAVFSIKPDGEVTVDSLDSPNLIGDIKWSAGGDYLAVNNFETVTILNVNKGTGKQITTTTAKSLQRMFWLNNDGVLATVAAHPLPAGSVGPDGKEVYGVWTVEFWHPENGEKIEELKAHLPVLHPYEMPPYIVNVSGRLYYGNLKFSLFAEDGRISEVQQTMKVQLVHSNVIALPGRHRGKAN